MDKLCTGQLIVRSEPAWRNGELEIGMRGVCYHPVLKTSDFSAVQVSAMIRESIIAFRRSRSMLTKYFSPSTLKKWETKIRICRWNEFLKGVPRPLYNSDYVSHHHRALADVEQIADELRLGPTEAELTSCLPEIEKLVTILREAHKELLEWYRADPEGIFEPLITIFRDRAPRSTPNPNRARGNSQQRRRQKSGITPQQQKAYVANAIKITRTRT